MGWTWFAAFMMILLGGWHVMAGLIAVVNDKFYVKGSEYIFQFDVTTWDDHIVGGISSSSPVSG